MNLSHYTPEKRAKFLNLLKQHNITLEAVLSGETWIGRKNFMRARCEYWKRHHCYYQQEKKP